MFHKENMEMKKKERKMETRRTQTLSKLFVNYNY